MSYYRHTNNTAKVQCGCYLALFVFNLLFGGWSVAYLLELFGKVIPFWGAVLIGLIVGQFSVPVACVVWLLKAFGVL